MSRLDPEAEVDVDQVRLPTLRELGLDLVRITPRQRLTAVALPFVWCGAYFTCAALGWWPAALCALAALSFVTYGSTSHDLVHRNLGLPPAANEVLLCLVELLALRSGHAYRAAHLHHHARFPHPDDIEAAAAGMSWPGALAEGVLLQPRIWAWAMRHARRSRAWVLGEGVACLLLVAVAAATYRVTPAPLVYVLLMILGSWPLPLLTAYIPHDPSGTDALSQTRAFRGVVASTVALGHLYHLEHHLYPAVPHHNWPKLARRLDSHLTRAGVRPIRLWF